MFIDLKTPAPQFSCSACGQCCSHIRGFIPQQDKKFIEEYAYGKLPVVQLVPIEQMTFPLWDWEAKRFEHWSQQEGIDAHIKPLRAIYDKISGKAIILTYFMDALTDACPLLNEQKKCSIYHTPRAYVCRLFPFNKSPFSFSGNVDKSQLFGQCGAMEKVMAQTPEMLKDAIPFLQHAFPDGSLENAIQNDIIIEWANKTIVELMHKKLINPLFNVPYTIIKEKINSAQKTDFTQFLVECGHIQADHMSSMLESFDKNELARAKILLL